LTFADLESLLIGFLSEVLYLIQRDGIGFDQFDLHITENRLQAAVSGQPIDHLASVASFFVSRVDTLVDAKLAQIIKAEGPGAAHAAALLGKSAVANSKLVYEKYLELFGGERFQALEAQGARRQRVLWASTGTKNPAYPDVLYIDTLIGPDTVNTVPPETYAAILDHTVVARTVDRDLDTARQEVVDLKALGIDLNETGEQLSVEGVEKFSKSFDGLLNVMSKNAALAVRQPIG
jgi:transaldolase